MGLLDLSGPSTVSQNVPQACAACGTSHFYRQPDFKRSLGLTLVGLATVATSVLFYFGYNWFLTWSPMLFVLLVDRLFLATRPTAVLCYKCGHIHRGLSKEQCWKNFAVFDLETQDRLLYAERTQESQ